MKKILFFTVAMGLLIGSTAFAADTTKRLGLGFVHWDAPVGGRYWFSEKAGLDVGLGVNVDDQGDESYTDWRVMVGIPINIHRVGERVNFNFLPAFQYASIDQGADTDSDIAILALLEFEVFVTPDFSVSASHGLAFDIYSYGADGVDSETDINLVGYNLTEFGFHYYLPGGE